MYVHARSQKHFLQVGKTAEELIFFVSCAKQTSRYVLQIFRALLAKRQLVSGDLILLLILSTP